MSDLRDTLYSWYVQDTDPRYPSGRDGWETYLIDHIAELERVAIIVVESGCTEDCIRNTYENIEGCTCGRDELAALLGVGDE